MRRNNFLIGVISTMLTIFMVGLVGVVLLGIVDNYTGIISQVKGSWALLRELPL